MKIGQLNLRPDKRADERPELIYQEDPLPPQPKQIDPKPMNKNIRKQQMNGDMQIDPHAEEIKQENIPVIIPAESQV